MRPLFRLVIASFVAACAAAAFAANPRLASLQIELWPEYDRPQTLVILKGELAPDVALPATLSLRIPAAAGAPTAVAYADASGKLLNLPYDRAALGQYVLVRLTTPQRAFHVEFYDPLASSAASREYRYEWPGDAAVERIRVLLKEPAAASDISVSPPLASTGTSPDGGKYRAAELGALKAGERLPIAVRYTKTDPRPTLEIIGPPAVAPAPERKPQGNLWLIGLGAAGLFIVAFIVFVGWRRSRVQVAAVSACPKCGHQSAADARFCASCGAALKKRRELSSPHGNR